MISFRPRIFLSQNYIIILSFLFPRPFTNPSYLCSGGANGKESTCQAGNEDLIPGSGRSPGEGNPLQYSCLENPIDQGAWKAIVHGVTKSQT